MNKPPKTKPEDILKIYGDTVRADNISKSLFKLLIASSVHWCERTEDGTEYVMYTALNLRFLGISAPLVNYSPIMYVDPTFESSDLPELLEETKDFMPPEVFWDSLNVLQTQHLVGVTEYLIAKSERESKKAPVLQLMPGGKDNLH